MIRFKHLEWAALFFSALPAVVANAAPSYTLTDLGTLGVGGAPSAGQAINATGQVTGYSTTFGSFENAFLYDGTMHNLGTLGGEFSYGWSINGAGRVAGSSDLPTYVNDLGDMFQDRHAILYDGTMHDLGTLGGRDSEARGINDSGLIVGSSEITPGGLRHGFLYDGTMHDLGSVAPNAINASGQITGSGANGAFLYDGTMHDLGTLGGARGQGNGINASGQITGSSTTSSGPQLHAFLYDGTMHDLGTLGATSSRGLGINASGQVTGDVGSINSPSQRAFIYDSVHGMRNLNDLIDSSLGWTLQSATGINDAGQITGVGFTSSAAHAFILTPVPEPSTLVLAALGFIAVFALGRRCRATRTG